jgi:hypothetical protein
MTEVVCLLTVLMVKIAAIVISRAWVDLQFCYRRLGGALAEITPVCNFLGLGCRPGRVSAVVATLGPPPLVLL